MLVWPSLLIAPAKDAGMPCPESLGAKIDEDTEYGFSKTEFPHFAVFCKVQLGREMLSDTEHWENAKVVAAVSDEEIKTITIAQLVERGLSYPLPPDPVA